jgi:hypothetical protein
MPACLIFQNLTSAPRPWHADLQNLYSAGLGTCFCQASGTISRAGWDAYWFAFLQDEPPYMALIFGERAVFRKTILRSSFADPSLLARSTLLVGALLYLGVGFDRANRQERQLEIAINKAGWLSPACLIYFVVP